MKNPQPELKSPRLTLPPEKQIAIENDNKKKKRKNIFRDEKKNSNIRTQGLRSFLIIQQYWGIREGAKMSFFEKWTEWFGRIGFEELVFVIEVRTFFAFEAEIF